MVVDDVGLHDGVTQAALQLVAAGRVQALGCMVGAPAWPDAQAALLALDAKLVDVGLHLDLLDYPLGPAAGWPRSLAGLALASGLRRLDRRSVQREICAQLDAFEQAMGRPPAFVDGHQHVHQFAQVRGLLLAELGRRYAGALPWLRSTCAPAALRWSAGAKPAVIQALGEAGLARAARGQGFVQNQHLLGVYPFDADRAGYLQQLARWLAASIDGDLLMCHPGTGRHDHDPISAARNIEYELLGGEAFGRLLAFERVHLQCLSRTLRESPLRA